MASYQSISRALLLVVGLALAGGVHAQPAAAKQAKPSSAVKATKPAPELEGKALDVLRAMSGRLAAARSMSFTSVVTHESPSRIGPVLAYTTKSEVQMQRPDKLRVLTLGDGPASEFYYDGKTMSAFAPAENLVAMASAPSTIDAMLKLAFDSGAIYFPFADVIAADPYDTIVGAMTVAFYIGQSKVVGGTTTDMVAIASDSMFVQIWVGADDKLPRMMRATFRGDTLRLRHQMELSDWKLDPVLAEQAFASLNAANAKQVAFAAPQPPAAAVKKVPARSKASGAVASKQQ